VDFSGKHWKF